MSSRILIQYRQKFSSELRQAIHRRRSGTKASFVTGLCSWLVIPNRQSTDSVALTLTPTRSHARRLGAHRLKASFISPVVSAPSPTYLHTLIGASRSLCQP